MAQTYSPRNYDGLFHGPVTVRSALANSYNIPAVKTLDHVGLPAFLDNAKAFGITTLTRKDYWLALTLGGGEVPLVEMAGTVSDVGQRRQADAACGHCQGDECAGQSPLPVHAARVRRPKASSHASLSPDTGKQVITPQLAYLITNILSDKKARCPAFGCPNLLELPFQPVAAKTGTTNDYKDNWTLGYTPDLVVGVWVGNADNSAMKGTTGVTGAAPIWHDFLAQRHQIHAGQGFRASARHCRKRDLRGHGHACRASFAPANDRRLCRNQMPLGPKLTRTARNAPMCLRAWLCLAYPGADPFVRAWAASPGGQNGRSRNGVTLVPVGDCSAGPGVVTGPVMVNIASPAEGATVSGNVAVIGTVSGPLDHYEVTWARGSGGAWEWVSGPHRSTVDNGPLTEWNVGGSIRASIRCASWHMPNTMAARGQARVRVKVGH